MLLLAISYSDGQAAGKALAHFVAAYLPEQAGKAPPASGVLTAKVEDGWLGVVQAGRLAVLAFRCPERRGRDAGGYPGAANPEQAGGSP